MCVLMFAKHLIFENRCIPCLKLIFPDLCKSENCGIFGRPNSSRPTWPCAAPTKLLEHTRCRSLPARHFYEGEVALAESAAGEVGKMSPPAPIGTAGPTFVVKDTRCSSSLTPALRTRHASAIFRDTSGGEGQLKQKVTEREAEALVKYAALVSVVELLAGGEIRHGSARLQSDCSLSMPTKLACSCARASSWMSSRHCRRKGLLWQELVQAPTWVPVAPKFAQFRTVGGDSGRSLRGPPSDVGPVCEKCSPHPDGPTDRPTRTKHQAPSSKQQAASEATTSFLCSGRWLKERH